MKRNQEKRFIKAYSQGTLEVGEVWIDTWTGVNYFFCQSGYAGGLSPLLMPDGTPIVSTQEEITEFLQSR